jgi:hypothetical protein
MMLFTASLAEFILLIAVWGLSAKECSFLLITRAHFQFILLIEVSIRVTHFSISLLFNNQNDIY